jgi:preprotein translocase subunit SecG
MNNINYNSPANTNYSMDSHSQMTSIYDYTNNLLTTPSFFIILVIVVVLYILFFITLGRNKSNDSIFSSISNNDNDNNSNISSNILTIIIICIFIFLLLVNGLQYFFGVNIVASIQNMFSNHPEVDIAITNPSIISNSNPGMPSIVPEIKIKKQVFNIPGNNYEYTDAKALCNAYGAELANYKQIEDSYNNGAEWCNYGWSDGQMALFPTQQKTFDGLQKIPNHENDCGRPGINGGFIANPGLKFGANCYGYKPVMTEEEEELMHDVPVYPKTVQDITLENRVNYWKERLPEILVSPFNHTNWSKI